MKSRERKAQPARPPLPHSRTWPYHLEAVIRWLTQALSGAYRSRDDMSLGVLRYGMISRLSERRGAGVWRQPCLLRWWKPQYNGQPVHRGNTQRVRAMGGAWSLARTCRRPLLLCSDSSLWLPSAHCVQVLYFERCQFVDRVVNISFHECVLLWSAVCMDCSDCTVYLALCLSQLHSKQHRLTLCVQLCVSGIFAATSLRRWFIYSCRASRKPAASPQHFSSCRSGCRELLRSDLRSRACITFQFKPISTWRNSRVYEMWCLAVPVSTPVQQAASFIQIIWIVLQSGWSLIYSSQHSERGKKNQPLEISEEQPVKEEYS